MRAKGKTKHDNFSGENDSDDYSAMPTDASEADSDDHSAMPTDTSEANLASSLAPATMEDILVIKSLDDRVDMRFIKLNGTI